MRDPFKDSGSADDWFNNLWTADVDMSTAMYGNTGTDMLYKSLIPKSPELTDVIDRADKRFGLGNALKSLFALLYMKEPEKNNDGGTLEQPVTDGVIKDEKYPQLKALCEDKKLPSFSAVCSFAESIEDVTENAEVQKAAEIAGIISELKAHSENLAERINAEPKPDKRLLLINRLFKKQKQIKDLNEKLREQRIKISAEIADNISAAAKKAFDAASQTAAVLRAFGNDDAAGGNAETDGALLDKVRENDTLKKISVMLGKYREIIADKRKNSFSYGLGEKYDITYGNDISNCLSSELALLGAPETEILFFKRYYEKHLQQYRRREPSVKGDGDIIVLADESSSTWEIAPWVKAFALALMDIALHGNKKFALVHFASSRNVKTDVFESGKYTTDDVLAAAEHFFGGGTDFETPLNEALGLLTNGFESADVVIITDGECEVSDEFAKRFTEEKLKNRLTVTGIITKFKYLKPDERNHFGGYAEYIATREGVEKIDKSKRNAPATTKQKQLIKKILSDFPDSKSSLEYEDYLKGKTIGAASEFITRALEENADEMMHTKTYADYIATRPRAERFGSHGLFTDDGVAVDLQKVSDELNAHTGNVWTAIVSLRREDAERLGYNNGSRWRDMLRSQAQTLSENLRIPMSNLRWFAAFHNESHHPHIHLIAYSINPNEGYLSEKGVMALRSSFAKDIFAQDLLCEYKKQTEHRDALKVQSREVLAELIAKINGSTYDNPQVEDLLQALAKRLAVTNGKKQYGYLRKDIKEIINSIVDELGKDERIAALYDLWYESKETAHRVYSESRPERLPLSQNKEFKSVKNMVIAEAMKLNLPTDEIEDTDEPVEPDSEPTVEETESPDPPPPPMDEYERTVADADKGNKWSQYRAAKFMLDRDGEHYDPKKAVEYLTKSAKQGYTVAKYMLGKLYLHGEDVPKQMLHALHWLESAVKDDNQYAEYLLGKTFLKGGDIERDTERAESLLSRSAEQENKYAAYTLGKAYLDGDILAQNIDKAVRLLTLSASRNFAPAQLILGRLLYKGEVVPKDIRKAVEWLDRAAAQKSPYAAYLAGKIYLTEDEVKDIQKAIRSFKIAAENGNDYAEYQLGKIYLYGKDIPRDTDKAMYYLHLAAEHGNQYAAQLIHSIRVNGNWMAALASLRLLGHMARVIQNRLEDERRGRENSIDRKLRRKIEEKKQAQGLKQ